MGDAGADSAGGGLMFAFFPGLCIEALSHVDDLCALSGWGVAPSGGVLFAGGLCDGSAGAFGRGVEV